MELFQKVLFLLHELNVKFRNLRRAIGEYIPDTRLRIGIGHWLESIVRVVLGRD